MSEPYTRVTFNAISDRTSDIDGYLLSPSEMEELHEFLLKIIYQRNILFILHMTIYHTKMTHIINNNK
jgi:hypothetical protein